MELLDFARGEALTISVLIFAFGTLWRLSTMLFAPRLRTRSEPRESAPGDATLFMQGVFARFWPHKKFERYVFTNHVNGYVFHLGLFVVVMIGTVTYDGASFTDWWTTTIESPVAKKATRRLIRCFSAGISLRSRSTRSSVVAAAAPTGHSAASRTSRSPHPGSRPWRRRGSPRRLRRRP